MTDKVVPTLYEWLGGIEALNRLTTRFYEHVKGDSLLAPVFAHMGADHPSRVAAFLVEVLGGPPAYSKQHGGHPHMIERHLNRHLTQDRRRRWISLLLETADALGMPDDPEFRSAWSAIWNGDRAWRSLIHSQAPRLIRTPLCPNGVGARSGVHIPAESMSLHVRSLRISYPSRDGALLETNRRPDTQLTRRAVQRAGLRLPLRYLRYLLLNRSGGNVSANSIFK
jgi:hemoglobin